MTDQSKDTTGDVFARLANCAVLVVTEYLKAEGPQTVAAVLLQQPPARAADILSLLPSPDFRHEVLRRMAESRPLLPPAQAALSRIIERDLLTAVPIPPGRGEEVRQIIALMPPDQRDAALAGLDAPYIFHAVAPVPYQPTPRRSGAPAAAPQRVPFPVSQPLRDETLPLLEAVYAGMIRRVNTSLRVLIGENIEVSLDHNITPIGHAAYMNSLPLPAVLSPFTAEGAGYGGVFVADPPLVYSLVAMLLGGKCSYQARNNEYKREFTSIERELFGLALASMIDDLSAALSEVTPVAFQFDRIETDPRFAIIAPLEETMLYARIRVDMEDGGGRAELLMPFSLFDSRLDVFKQRILPPGRNPRPHLVAG
jgi:hypothetical protein